MTSQSTQPEKIYKTPDPRPHHVELDGLRGIAIVSAVVTHILVAWPDITGRYLPLLGVELFRHFVVFSFFAIPVFFMLSGYLLTWTEEARERRGSYGVVNYAKRRVLRVVPTYYVAIAVAIPVSILLVPPLFHPAFDPSFEAVALHLTFLHGLAPSYPLGLDLAWWSLTPEIIFYAMLPLLVLKFRKFSQRATICGLLLLVSVATRLLQTDTFGLLPLFSDSTLGQERISFFPTTTLYLFLVGMLLRMMVERHTSRAGRKQPRRRQLFVASILTVVPAAVLLIVLPYLIFRSDGTVRYPVSNLAEAMVVLVFASALLGSPLLKPVLGFRPLVFLGKISYSLFLLHDMVIIIVRNYTQNTIRILTAHLSEPLALAAFITFALIMLAMLSVPAYLSYRYIESPFLRYKPK